MFFIYDGNNSSGAVPAPDGSAELEKLFEGYYQERGVPFEEVAEYARRTNPRHSPAERSAR